jgi:serine/threonine protein kinase
MADERNLVNRVLLGRYRLEKKLGEGGMGAIWQAQHLVLNAPVAVKVIDRDVVADEDTTARFMREAQAAATLRSPHVVQILDYGVDEKVPFIVMELLEGENLAQRLRTQKRLSPAETVKVLTEVSRAVGRAHEAGIVHRDLKPENIFLVRNEDEELAKVLDFGVAKVENASLGPEGTRTRTGSLLGTPYYMSPEQAQGNKTVDTRSDLWSLGVIAFECLTGRRPFFSDGLGDLVLQICVRDIPVPSETAPVPVGFDAWFAHATKREPEERFQTARSLIEALRAALGFEARDEAVSSPDVFISQAVPSLPPGAGPETEKVPTTDTSTSERPASLAKTVLAEDAATTSPGASGTALTERQFGTTQHSIPGSKSSSLLRVTLVAIMALCFGIGGGVWYLWKQRSVSAQALPAGASPASVPKAKRKHKLGASPRAKDATEEGAGQGEDAGADPSDDPAGSRAAAEKGAAAIDAGQQPAQPAPDAGWVKPAWAIPDEELGSDASAPKPSPEPPPSAAP